ncbi:MULTISPECIES: helix-turn-helix transcriptional regulator [Lactobacillus]|uniref:XRE family transcriptional regulator n=1 Tax=Lactobacillus xujianguonis TaxID=2495899 RepID=A0A437SUX3_9LACO|nr:MULTISPECIES: helix-turn-helix transcriptional regulator [Lactobacillus]MBL1059471.1 helix-turn-helix transcriptional regulator [Lactobacillus sp. A27]RVU70731.1 XRE family transcriptional regulator [Lactobacillus xujianguonis]RVU72049.1 XRE family transcriptional regulator [Lactobacillus xujianguonis]DAO35250.1 MAG TPA: helix-turn-helix domain protein [Caudoviricetes sp.]
MKFTVKQAREYRNLTQREAAKQLGIALATYQGYEWGDVEMRIGMAKRFAKMVEIPLDQLIFYSKTS